MVRSHRRDEPGRRTAFRILTAVIISGTGLGVTLAATGGSSTPHSTPARSANEVSRGQIRVPAPETPRVDETTPQPSTSTAANPTPTATGSTPAATQPRLAARNTVPATTAWTSGTEAGAAAPDPVTTSPTPSPSPSSTTPEPSPTPTPEPSPTPTPTETTPPPTTAIADPSGSTTPTG